MHSLKARYCLVKLDSSILNSVMAHICFLNHYLTTDNFLFNYWTRYKGELITYTSNNIIEVSNGFVFHIWVILLRALKPESSLTYFGNQFH